MSKETKRLRKRELVKREALNKIVKLLDPKNPFKCDIYDQATVGEQILYEIESIIDNMHCHLRTTKKEV